MSETKSSASSSSSSTTSSEYFFTEKWDKCLERSAINITGGLVVGGLVSLVLARGGGMQKAITAFGAGCGAGASWVKCDQDLNVKVKK